HCPPLPFLPLPCPPFPPFPSLARPSFPMATPEPMMDHIPGSMVKGRAAVEAVHRALECVVKDGRWKANEEMRVLPWNRNPNSDPQLPNYGTCDVLHETEAGGVMGDVADEIVRTNGSPADWKVRPELLFDWKPATGRGCPPYVPFTREKLCRLLARRNVVMVGDGTQLLLHDVFLNNMYSLQSVDQMGNLEDACACVFLARALVAPCALHMLHILFLFNTPYNPHLCSCPMLFPICLSHALSALHSFSPIPPPFYLLYCPNKHPLPPHPPRLPSPAKRYVETLRDTMQLLRRLAPDVLVVFRSTWRGHVDCGRAEGPLKEVPGKGGATLPWDFAIEQNNAARAIMKVR
ncbi:unnamed protein product, partial [Closterium sp. NIES-54]